jgi:hypothetical protein
MEIPTMLNGGKPQNAAMEANCFFKTIPLAYRKKTKCQFSFVKDSEKLKNSEK